MATDGDIKQAAGMAATDFLPHVALDQSLTKTKEIVHAVQQLQKAQEETDRKASKEIKSHAQTKEKIKVVEHENAQARQLMEFEMKEHLVTKDKLDRAERDHNKTRDSLQAQRHEVSSMLLQMEALKVEMEAQRKAFVVNVNWAARCTELKVKFDASRGDYDKLWEQNISTKAALEVAQKAQEEYRNKSTETLESLEEAQAQVERQMHELANRKGHGTDVDRKLEEWGRYKEAQNAEVLASKQGRSKALSVLERQLAQGDHGIAASYFNVWEGFTQDEIKRRKHKDQAMKRSMKTIANEGMGLVSQCFTPWRKDMETQKRHQLAMANKKLEEANARSGGGAEIARKRALEQLEKQFLGQDKALIKQAFGAWASGQALRKKKDANLQKGARMIANSGKALVAEIILVWNVEAEKTRKKKKEKEGAQNKAARMIAGSSKALQANIFQEWTRWVKKLGEGRKAKAAGNEKAMRMMANSDKALSNICFDSWMKIQQEKKKKDQGNKKAARMISGSNDVLVKISFEEWKKMSGGKKEKEKNTAKAVRMIAASGEALQAATFQGWIADIRKCREKNKKLRAVEKTLGASADGIKQLVHTAWRTTIEIEGRMKRGKSRTMGAAMKSINSNKDLLMTQIFMGFARMAARAGVDKLQEKVSAAQAALDDAMALATKAVEEDVAKVGQEAETLRAELETVKKALAETKGKVDAMESQIEQSDSIITERQQQQQRLVAELEESRRKAKDIGEELAKVGIFLQGSGNRKQSRPRSGAKADPSALPRIGSAGRPQSGSRGGSKGGAPVPPTKPAWNEADGQVM